MTEQIIKEINSDHLNSTSPIIHLPESDHLRSSKNGTQVVMVTSSSKVKTSSSTCKKSDPTKDTIIIHPGNFNLCRPGRSTEVLNGLQRTYMHKQESEAAQCKESAKLLLDFIRKRQKNSTDKETVDNKTEQDEQVIPVKTEQNGKVIKHSNA